ncbi:MAG: phage tail protein [Chloroflexota bacterium]|nr:phage tail protein [Chloroflexota bacterium]
MNEERTTSRRRFLGTAAGATGVALAAAAWKPAQAAAAVPDIGQGTQSPTAVERRFRPGVFQLNLGGTSAGFLKAIDGGDAYADVITIQPSTGFPVKQIANVKFDDFAVQLDFGMNKLVYDWIAASWKMNYIRKQGSITSADFNYQAKSERQFRDALITETSFPALDASSKDAGYLTLQFAPEETIDLPASGALSAPASKQKLWITSNFKLQIDGIDATKVSKIDAFSVKQQFIDSPTGENRIGGKEPGKLEFPNLKITLAQSSIATWATWFDDFVIKGNNGADKEKNGRIVFLSPDLQTELGEIKLINVGIFRLDPDADDPSSADKIARFTAEIYVEQMQLNVPPVPVIT